MKKKYLTMILFVLFTLNKLSAQEVEHIVVGNNVVITINSILGEIDKIDILYSVSGSNYKKIPENELKICDDRQTILWTNPSISNTNLNDLKFKLTLQSIIGFNRFRDNRDGKIYKIVKIGNQVWMAENLAYKPSIGNYWAPDNDQSNVAKYGYLYDWETAKQIAPKGWHLPTKQEFKALLNNLGGSGKQAYEALTKGGNSGLNILFGGWRDDNSSYEGEGDHANFWSATKYDDTHAWYCYLHTINKSAGMYKDSKSVRFSVRLIRDR